jgi:hypothetical protein
VLGGEAGAVGQAAEFSGYGVLVGVGEEVGEGFADVGVVVYPGWAELFGVVEGLDGVVVAVSEPGQGPAVAGPVGGLAVGGGELLGG